MRKVLLFLFLFQSMAWAGPFEARQAPPLVAKAQQAYLEGDFSLALNTLKPAYMASVHDSVARKSVLDLFGKIRKISPQPRLDVGWTLPPEIGEMRVSTARRLDNGLVTHLLNVSGNMSSPEEIVSFQVIRYPDTIVLDKAQKIGNFKFSHEASTYDFDFRSKAAAFDVSSGLYLMTFTTKSGHCVDGWFMLDENANSTSQPQISNFDGNPVFNTGTPKMEWNDFTSPQYNPNVESRSLSIWVGKADRDEGVWSFWTRKHMDTTNALLGSPVPAGVGWDRGPLENGKYYVLLNYMESQNFGPIKIIRRSGTVKYFTIQK